MGLGKVGSEVPSRRGENGLANRVTNTRIRGTGGRGGGGCSGVGHSGLSRLIERLGSRESGEWLMMAKYELTVSVFIRRWFGVDAYACSHRTSPLSFENSSQKH